MSNDIEIELKFPLKNAQTVIDFLNKNAVFKYEKSQHDVYYNHPSRDFLEDNDNVNEWLRIRVSGNEAEINYKDWLPHEAKVKTHCTEYETTVSSYDQLRKILDALNFKKMIEVKKNRKSWNYMETEISIDSVYSLGEFIEVEYKGSLSDVVEARKHLFEIIKTISAETGELDLNGYPYLLLKAKGLLP
jgi:adenylate cyclase class 2